MTEYNIAAKAGNYCVQVKNQNKPIDIWFFHGFLGDNRIWNTIVPLIEPYANCYLFDFIGHGKSIWYQDIGSEEKTIESLGEGFSLLKSKFYDPKKKTLGVGYSMGARWLLALLFSGINFDKVILESGSPGLESERERLERLRIDKKRAFEIRSDYKKFLTQWNQQDLFKIWGLIDNKRLIEYEEIQSQQNPEQIALTLEVFGTGRYKNYWPDLQQLEIPVTLIVGDKDDKFVKINQRMKNTLEDAEICIFPNCGHRVHLEYPKAYADQIINCINS